MARFLHTGDWQLGMTRVFLDAKEAASFSVGEVVQVSTKAFSPSLFKINTDV